MIRKARVLYGVVIGAAIGLAQSAFDDPTSMLYTPQTTAEWISYYISYSLPFAAVGAVIGALARRKPAGSVQPAVPEPGAVPVAGSIALPRPTTVLERLGYVLGWTGNLIAALLVGLGLYGFTQPGGDTFVEGAAIVIGVVAFLIGRACRYVLAGSS